MKITLISSFDAFLKLKQPWNELSRQSPDDHAFMRHEWFEHWLLSQEMTHQLHMITGWQDGQLVGVLPLVWNNVTLRGLRFRSMGFAESPVSPRCNALILEQAVLGPLVERLTSEPKCQLIELEHLEADSPTTGLLVDCLRRQTFLLVHVSPGRQSPYLTLNCSWDEYLKALSSTRRAWIRNKCIKKLSSLEQPYEFHFINDATGAAFLADAMTRISSRSWKAGVGRSIDQVPSQRRLYAEFTPVGLAHGMVKAVVLTIGDRPVAFDYYLTHGRRYSLIRGDFDRDFAKCRPGENLRIALISSLGQAEGAAEIDFGGTVSDYKLGWANGVRNHFVIHAAKSLRKGAFVLWWKKAKAGRSREVADGETDIQQAGPATI